MVEITEKPLNDHIALEGLIQSNDHQQLVDFLDNLLPVELVREFYELTKEDQIRLIKLLGPEKSAD